MPLIEKKHKDKFTFALWKVDEDLSFFMDKIKPVEEEENLLSRLKPKRALEWYASRYLLALLHGKKDRVPVSKDKSGKPFFANEKTKISISHSGDLVTACISLSDTGIDVQLISEKVIKIKEKFLSEAELRFCDNDILCLNRMWTIKEAVYKAYGKKGLIFKENIRIPYFFKDKNGYIADAKVKTKDNNILYHIYTYDYEKAILSIAIEHNK